ncbi:MAG: (deoxy)nucleoside triphosphate pyrophosphohydrolase [Bacteroidales bacterium]|nr:(deoxy)nucleoside triphosphate pyrophosphohydrolase [Bacteroidales bacterium]
MNQIDVVAAVIINENNEILIARRKQNISNGGKWEFPGGKLEKGETHEMALERELLEEFNIITKTGKYIGSKTHTKDKISINLYVYFSTFISGNFELSDHDKITWENAQNLKKIDFSDADIHFVKMLQTD